MRNKEGLSYFWKRKRIGKPFAALGFSLPVALLFALCLISVFRPYYEHQNAGIPSDSLALSYDRKYEPALSFSEIREKEASFAPEEWNRLEDKKSKQENVFFLEPTGCYLDEHALIAPDGFELSRLGNCEGFPLERIEEGEGFHVFLQSDFDRERLPRCSLYQEIPEGEQWNVHLYPEGTPQSNLDFMPRQKARVLFLFPEAHAPKNAFFTFGSLYATFALRQPLSDEEVNYFASISPWSPGLLPQSVDWLIHPALDYVRFYPLYHSITTICFTLAVSISFALFLSQLGKEFLKTRKEKGEVFSLKILGMKKSAYVLGATSVKGMPFYLGFLAWYLLYFAFMGIFQATAGFAFFFPWWGHLLYWAFPLSLCAYLSIKADIEFRRARPSR